MKLAWILWLSHVLPQPAADSLCLSTTVYLEARDQSALGQQAVAEVALRRRDSGLWGRNLCQVVTARKQFAPTLLSPQTRLSNIDAWTEAVPPHRLPAPAGTAPIKWPRLAITRSIACKACTHVAAFDCSYVRRQPATQRCVVLHLSKPVIVDSDAFPTGVTS